MTRATAQPKYELVITAGVNGRIGTATFRFVTKRGKTAHTDKADVQSARDRDRLIKGAAKVLKLTEAKLRRQVEAECNRFVDDAVKRQEEAAAAGEDDGGHRTQADLLVQLVKEAGVELFHAPGGNDSEEYATIPIGNHKETWPVCSKGFRRWLGRLYYAHLKKAPGGQALQDAVNVIAGKALHEGPERPVAVRVAQEGSNIYLDLANADWQAVEITPTGWRLVVNPPVRFLRKRGLLPLPTPVAGGSVDELRPLVNLPDEDAWRLFVAWLIAALRPGRPFPVLCVNGEQGSAKSTLCRMGRALIDPSVAPLRRPPRDERDLAIAAANSWVVGYDNLSGLPTYLSDAICSLATGGGFSTRELYTDSDERIFDATRPVMLNGIEDVATRSDLLDRAVILTLPTIPDQRRRDEEELLRDYEAVRPRVLGALLDAVSAALHNRPSVRLTEKPRMADFACWIVAAEPALGWPAGTFLGAYGVNRGSAHTQALENSVLAPVVFVLSAQHPHWTGTARQLLADLEKHADEKTKRSKGWPTTPSRLSAELRRLAPCLRAVGVSVFFEREPDRLRRRLIRLERACKTPSAASAASTPPENTPAGAGRSSDGSDGSDAADGDLPSCSDARNREPGEDG
jgi:hypothetical protein